MKNLKKVLMTVLMLVVFLVPATGCGEKNYGGIVESYEFVEMEYNTENALIYDENKLDLKIKLSKNIDTSKTYYVVTIGTLYYSEFNSKDLDSLLINSTFTNYLRTLSSNNDTDHYHFYRSCTVEDNSFITVQDWFLKSMFDDKEFPYTHLLIYNFNNVTDPNTDLLNYIGYIRF